MERGEILSQVQDIFRDQLDDGDVTLRDETTAADVDGWDSLMHLQLIVAIENHFKVKFSSKEIMSWKNVGEMIDCLQKRNA
ncbi:MAG: acyl carrier protein [Treponema sp.]|jgi:acyl carrier protein|nr:acyl carrier protein [Treponema sp.]